MPLTCLLQVRFSVIVSKPDTNDRVPIKYMYSLFIEAFFLKEYLKLDVETRNDYRIFSETY